MTDKTLIFTATYNEAENISALVRACLQELPDSEMLVIDDSSPDGTGLLLDQLAKDLTGRVSVIHRPGKMGLGTAHILAMRYALKHGYHKLITMDADFSHHPRYLGQFSRLLAENDFVIGSRYIEGGRCDYLWKRQLLSKGANFLARTLLGLKLRELTTSYRGFSRNLLEKMPFDQITSEGYSFFFEAIFCVSQLTDRMVEFPIHFEDRRAGVSKISKKEIYRAVGNLFRLFGDRILGRRNSRRKFLDSTHS